MSGLNDASHNIADGEAARTILYIVYVFEAIACILSTPAFLMCCYGLTKSSILHRNLIYIMQFHFCAIYASILPRPIIILYADTVSPTVLFTAQFMNLYCRLTSFTSFTSVLIERNFASYFVNDYEKEPRKWIALLVIFASCFLSFLYTATVCYGVISLRNLAIALLVMCLICSVVYILLYRRDNKRLHMLTNDVHHIRYKLTTRFQLTENLRVLKLTMFGSIIYTIWAIVSVTSVLMIIHYFPVTAAPARMCFAFLDMFIAVSILTLFLCTLVSIDQFRLSRYISLPCHRSRETLPTDGTTKTTEVYFQHLNVIWK